MSMIVIVPKHLKDHALYVNALLNVSVVWFLFEFIGIVSDVVMECIKLIIILFPL